MDIFKWHKKYKFKIRISYLEERYEFAFRIRKKE